MLGFGADKSTLWSTEREKRENVKKKRKKRLENSAGDCDGRPLIEAERVASKKDAICSRPLQRIDFERRQFVDEVVHFVVLSDHIIRSAHRPPESPSRVADRRVHGQFQPPHQSKSERNALVVDQRIVCTHQARVACVEVSSKARRQCASDHGHVFIAAHCKAKPVLRSEPAAIDESPEAACTSQTTQTTLCPSKLKVTLLCEV